MSKSNFIVRGGGDFSGLYKELNQAQKRMEGFKKGISSTVKGIGAIFGGLAVGSLIKDFANTAMRTETLEVAMNSVARASGYATDTLQEHKKAVRDMGIANQESMTILTRFMQAQLDTADASKLARVAQDAAVIANVNSSEAAEQMTEAIAKQRPELLSAFGMTKNLNVILSEYANTLGKTVKELDETERKQAMLNYILSEGEKIAGTYEASMGAVGKQIGSLPRHWQDLKNAIATPLALPGISVAVQAITNALKNAVVWAEANNDVLAHYGRIVAGVVEGAVKGFTWIGQTLSNNWNMIKNIATALFSYAVAMRVVTTVAQTWRNVSLALNGALTAKIPILSMVNQAVVMYKAQMATAPIFTNALSASMYKLQAALYSVYSAIGPVGWAIIGVSALIAGAMGLWGKYSNSVMRTNQSIQQSTALTEEQKANLQKSNEALKSMNENARLAGQGQNKLADGIKKAEKAAKGSLAGFDEINTIQDNMGGSDVGGAGVPKIDIPDVSVPDIDIPNMDFGDLGFGDALDQIEMQKPTLKGFWDWLKTGFSNGWEKVKESSSLANWFLKNSLSKTWDNVKENWGKFTGWASRMWDGVKTSASLFNLWTKQKFTNMWESTKKAWGKFTEWASNMWEGTKTAWTNFTKWVSEKWTGMKENTSKIWDSSRIYLENLWNNLKNNAKTIFTNLWNNIKGAFSSTKTWFGNTFGGAWDRIKNVFSISNVRSTFNSVWNTIKSIFSSVPNWFRNQFHTAWTNVKNVFSSGGKIFTGIKDGIARTFRTIVNGLIRGINRVIRTPFNAINKMLNTIRNVSVLGISPFKNLWSQNPLSVPQIPMLAQGGYIGANKPLLAMIGDNKHEGEIVAPESKLYEQTYKAITDALSNGGKQEIVVQLGRTEVFREIINGINNTQRQAGKTLLDV